MKAPRHLIRVIAVSLSITALLLTYFISPLPEWLRVSSLKRQVAGNINAAELQRWATNLLSQHAGDISHYRDYDGTNLPSGLKRVRGFGHAVEVAAHSGQPEPEVWIFCRGPKGSPFMVVGPASLTTPKSPNIVPWTNGIYFVYSGGWR
jgi:hypothetical protein